MTTFAALGDSITDGATSTVNANKSWPSQLAERLAANSASAIATSILSSHIPPPAGACASQIEREQLPRALGLRPDIASVIFGINDTLRPGFDPELIERSAAHTVGALRAAGAEVLTMRLPDAGRMLGLPVALARPLARRTQLVNSVLDAVAGALAACISTRRLAGTTTGTCGLSTGCTRRARSSDDRRSFHALWRPRHQLGPAPDAEPANQPPSRLAEFGWMATKGTAWVLRRSTDLVPYLLAMAVAELVGSARRSHVGAQPSEQFAQVGDLLVSDAVAQPLIEAERGGAQREEHLIACGRELHDVDPAVQRVPLTADQPGAPHRIEVVRQRRLPDPDRVTAPRGWRARVFMAVAPARPQLRPPRLASSNARLIVRAAWSAAGLPESALVMGQLT
jgi:lysophospholipase L1-like esterase